MSGHGGETPRAERLRHPSRPSLELRKLDFLGLLKLREGASELQFFFSAGRTSFQSGDLLLQVLIDMTVAQSRGMLVSTLDRLDPSQVISSNCPFSLRLVSLPDQGAYSSVATLIYLSRSFSYSWMQISAVTTSQSSCAASSRSAAWTPRSASLARVSASCTWNFWQPSVARKICSISSLQKATEPCVSDDPLVGK